MGKRHLFKKVFVITDENKEPILVDGQFFISGGGIATIAKMVGKVAESRVKKCIQIEKFYLITEKDMKEISARIKKEIKKPEKNKT